MKTAVIIILAVLLTWYVATFGIPFSCDIPEPSPQPPPPSPSPYQGEGDYSLIEWDIFNLINKEREAEGLLILTWNDDLEEKAEGLSKKMLASQNYEHSDWNVYENIYWGINVSPNRLERSCFETWMESERHKENILEPSIWCGAVGIASDNISTFITFMAE